MIIPTNALKPYCSDESIFIVLRKLDITYETSCPHDCLIGTNLMRALMLIQTNTIDGFAFHAANAMFV